MGFSDLLMGQFIDVIENDKDMSHLIVLKYQRNGRDNEIKQGARLIVRESQAAVFMSKGELADVFSAGSYTLNTENMPILSTLQSWKYGFRSPIISDLFFVSLKALTDNKWGTRNPFIIEDPTFGVVRVRGFGTFSLRVVDVEKFMRELVGVQMIYQTDDVIEFVRSIVIESLIDVIAEEKIRVVELASKLREISEAARDSANEKMETMGISLLMINIENISLPEEVEKFIDEQSGINLVSGNMQNFQQWQQLRAMRDAAQQSQGIAGIGAGFAFAQQMNTTAAQPQEPVVKEVIRIKCPNCGELNKEDAKFCCECGTSLITKKYCPQCGGEVETDSKFCSTCGQKL